MFFNDLVGEIVAFGAHAVRPIHAEVGIGVEIVDELPGAGAWLNS